ADVSQQPPFEPPAAEVRPEAEPANAGLVAPALARPAPLLAAAHDPAADYAAQLQPEAGVPLVDGAPASVAAPVAAQRINTLFGIGAVILLVVTVVVVILLAIFVINLLANR
ncbi:MAG TPA: hypothetical protein VGR61_06750, partial [Candidatus Dormibacteraeota bacterium]|nr:hypothetical protein [Candidatus Dormibacteraeota bacterium]